MKIKTRKRDSGAKPRRTLLQLLPVLLFAALITASCDGGVPPDLMGPTTIILVRHAEKATGSVDPPLTTAGLARAAELAFTLEDVPIDAVYSTSLIRALQTAEAVAEDQHLDVLEYEMDAGEDFLIGLLETHRGGTVLVVGHSGTIPQMANLLTGTESYSSFGTYDALLVAQTTVMGQASIVTLQYRVAP